MSHQAAGDQSDQAVRSLQVPLNLESKSSHVRKANKKAMLAGSEYRRKTGHAFSAENPYGKRDAQDKRQFSRI